MNKVLVTGASGHIGYHVADQLLKKGYKVVILTRSINANINELQTKGATIHKCDLLIPDTYSNKLRNCRAVFHLAAKNTVNTSLKKETLEGTVDLTKIFFAEVIEHKIPTIIYTSSVVTLGRSKSKKRLVNLRDAVKQPESPYVEGKTLSETYCSKLIEEQDIDIRRIYPTWVVGSDDQGLTPPHRVIKDYLVKGQKFYFKGGISIADVCEVAKTHVNALEIGKRQGRYIAGGTNITFKQLYFLLAEITEQKPPRFLVPKAVIMLASICFEPIFRLLKMASPASPGYVRAIINRYSWYDSSNTEKELDYNIKDAKQLLTGVTKEIQIKLLGVDKLKQKPENVSSDSSAQDPVLITGVPGWLGNRLVDTLMNGNTKGQFASNRKVHLFVQERNRDLLKLPDNFKIFYGDLSKPEDITPALEGVKSVLHLAGAIYPKKISTLYKVNFDGTKNLIDGCINNQIKRFIYVSTDSVCGKGTRKQRIFADNARPKPYRNYGKSKFLAEDYVLKKSDEGLINGTALRAFWFFGPFAPERQQEFLNMFKWPRQLIFGNGKNYRNITHIDNLIKALLLVEDNSNTFGKWYWIGDPEPRRTVDDIYRKIAEVLQVKYKPFYIPVFVCRMFNILDWLMGKVGILHPTVHAAGKFYFDITGGTKKAKEDFNYTPVISFDETLEELKKLV